MCKRLLLAFLFWVVGLAVVMSGAAGLQAATLDRTIAKLNQDILTESDLAAAVAETHGLLATDPSINAFRDATTETIGSLFDRRLLVQEAKRIGVQADNAELQTQVEQMVQDIRANFPTEAAFREELAREGISLDRLQKDLMKRAREDFQVYHAVSSRFSVSQSDIDDYEAREGKGAVSFRLRRLGVAVKGKDTARACAEAKTLVARMVTEGIPFDEGIRKYSQIPGAAADGGDLGYMSADKLAPAVLEAVKDLKAGQASAPVVAGGFANVFYLESKKGARTAVLERRFYDNRQELLRELRRKAQLQIFDERLYPLLPEEYIQEGRKSVVGQPRGKGATAPVVERTPGARQPAAAPTATPAPTRGRGWGGFRSW